MSTARAIINLDLPGPVISRHLYGHFAEHLGRCIYGGFWVGEDSEIPNEGGIRLDVVEALRALRIPNLRWPGGCFADDYHWRDGIGPRDQRPRMVNSHWGDVVEDNSFGTHEFLALCELLDAQPYVNGNVGSGTVAEMSEWIEYLTRADDSPMASLRREHGRDEPWRVPFFGIGNEPWGCGGNMRGEAYADLARQYSTYVRDHGGNHVYRIAAGAHDDDVTWTRALMEALTPFGTPLARPGVFQGISLHYYTTAGPWESKGSATVFDDDDYWRTMAAARRIEPILRAHASVMDSYDPDRLVGLVLDEWGTWWDVEPGTNPGFLYQQNTLRDALVASVHFDVFHAAAERLVISNIAQTVNVLQAMIQTDPDSGALVLTPTYHVFAMNAGHQDAARLDAHLVAPDLVRQVAAEEVPTLSLSASTKDGAALVSISNLDLAGSVELTLDLRGDRLTDPSALVLTADRVDTCNDVDHRESVAPQPLELVVDGDVVRVTIPAHSFVTVRGTVA